MRRAPGEAPFVVPAAARGPMSRVHALRSRLGGRHGYAILLVLVIVSAVYTVAAPDRPGWHLGVVLIQAAIVATAVLVAHPREAVRVFSTVVVVLALAAALVSVLSEGNSKTEFSLLAAVLAALMPLVVWRGLTRTLREEGASERVIAAALSLYLLIGMFCAYVYGAIGELGAGPLFAGRGDGDVADHVYFSFVTQTTVGYGDFTPEEPVARAVAIAQALSGQLYLVTVISLLVGGYLGRAQARLPREPPS